MGAARQRFVDGLPVLLIAGATAWAAPASAASAPTWTPEARVVPSPRTPDAATTERELRSLRSLASHATRRQLRQAKRSTTHGVVEPWIRATLDEVVRAGTNPVRASRVLAAVSVAASDALQAARRARSRTVIRSAPCELEPALRRGRCVADGPVSRSAVVASAAATVLASAYPERRAELRSLRSRAVRSRLLSGAAYPSDARVGTRLGRVVGRAVVARLRGDGSGAAWTGTPPVGERYWVTTPPGFGPPAEPMAGTWRPWNIDRGSQLRVPPPPVPGSAEFDAEVRAVYDAWRNLTAKQKRIARFWADGAGTVTPPGHWNEIALSQLRRSPRPPERAALILALLNTAQADAFIACWESKFHYWLLRPVTAIRRTIDPAWISYVVTPPFPAYPSGHSSTSGAAATVLARFFHSRARKLRDWSEKAAISRLYGGIHFPVDNSAGLTLGKRAARAALRRVRD